MSNNISSKKIILISIILALTAGMIIQTVAWLIANRGNDDIFMGSANPLIDHMLDDQSDVNTIRNIITNNPDHINIAGVMGYYPIHRSVLLEYDIAKHIIPFLVNKGADINQRSLPSGSFGNVPTFEVTALHITANNKSIDSRITELLLTMGADATIKDGNGLTPLDAAIKSSNDDAVKLIEIANSQAGDATSKSSGDLE